MKDAVSKAIEEIREQFPGHTVEVSADSEGGAYIRVHALPFGGRFKPTLSWVTFHITYLYPNADVYPHFLPPELVRADGNALGEGFQPNHEMKLGTFTGQATQVSRKSKNWNPAQDTAALKLAKVLDWIQTRP